nr:MAG TPA: hypothetical protein [Caudoviricetes sp.]
MATAMSLMNQYYIILPLQYITVARCYSVLNGAIWCQLFKIFTRNASRATP